MRNSKKSNKQNPNLVGKKIIRIRAEINEIELKKYVEKISETEIWFSVKIDKIDKPLARLIKEKERRHI